MSIDPDQIRVIDCTLRDGGYYNHWDFRTADVERYLSAVGAAGVDVIEIGFRGFAQATFLGPFAYSTDEFLGSLKVPSGATLGVMVNASELVGHADGPAAAVDALFAPAADSPVSLVRIAAHVKEAAACEPALARLRDLGYTAVINLMQVSRYDDDVITDLGRVIDAWGTVEALYFADSLGNMRPADVEQCVEALRRGWTGAVGVHTHDNCGRALANTLAAAEVGATWLDATILGMGRGAGNTRTDFLLFELVEAGVDRYRPAALVDLTEREFAALRREHGWGTNLLYFMSAAYEVHPTYVQMMQSDDRYEAADIVHAVEVLQDLESHSYSADRLRDAALGAAGQAAGTWDATGWLDGRDVLIVASGPSLDDHRDELVRYILRAEPAVLCLNANPPVPDELITAYAACHPTRIMVEAGLLAGLTKPLVAPRATLQSVLGEAADKLTVLDYGVAVRSGEFTTEATGCTTPSLLAIAYALALAVSAGGRRILLAGADGYPAGDPRQEEMLHVLDEYAQMPSSIDLVAITPTSYPVAQSSLYAPHI
jgi:4-hydroxy 2-oxovalerate aldolase